MLKSGYSKIFLQYFLLHQFLYIFILSGSNTLGCSVILLNILIASLRLETHFNLPRTSFNRFSTLSLLSKRSNIMTTIDCRTLKNGNGYLITCWLLRNSPESLKNSSLVSFWARKKFANPVRLCLHQNLNPFSLVWIRHNWCIKLVNCFCKNVVSVSPDYSEVLSSKCGAHHLSYILNLPCIFL